MKNRAPKFAVILLLSFSLFVFTYFNFCPSVGVSTIHPNALLADAKENFTMPEIDAAVKVIKAVVGFIFQQ